MQKVFLNDKIINADKASISTSDTGFLYGAGLFETMRAANGVVFALEDHLSRLFTSAGKLSIEINCAKEYVRDAVYKTLDANKLTDARLRITVTSGSPATNDNKRSTILIAATKFKPYPFEHYQKGVLTVLSPYKQNPDDPTTGHKTLSYLPRMLALEQARRKNAAESIWFTTDHRLAEASISNIFIVKDSALYTPPVSTPVLPGIARKSVFEIAAQKSIKLEEKELCIEDVLAADEIFLTNTIMQIIPVVFLEKHVFSDGKPGPLTRKLTEYFREHFEKACSNNEAE